MFKSEEQFRHLAKCLETNLHQRETLNSYSTVKFLKIFLKLFPHETSLQYLRDESNILPSSSHLQHAKTCFKLAPTDLSSLPATLSSDPLSAAAKSLQSCPTLCDPMDCSLRGSTVHGIFQARVLEWGAIAFSGSSL